MLHDRFIVVKKAKYEYIYDGFGESILHHPFEPAIVFPDGTSYHYVNGTYYPNWIYDDDKSKFKIKMILSIKNAAIRIEAIRQFGINEFFSKAEMETLDKNKNYELVKIKIGRRNCEYLRMINPSTGEIHFEGVKPGVKTISEALSWRMDFLEHKDPHFES